MDLSGLSLQQAPPFSAIYRFFLTAPVFLFMAGLYILATGSDLLQSHLGGQIVAFVHLITLGFLSMTMIGALLQMIPVMVGATMKNPLGFSRFIYYIYVPGVVLFFIGFYLDTVSILILAFVLLLSAIFTYTLTMLCILWKNKIATPTSKAMAMSIFSFFVGALFGLSLLYVKITGNYFFFEPGFFPLHLYWVLAGWVFSLVMAVSFRIIPMFYVTPEYPRAAENLIKVVFATALLFSFVWALPGDAQMWKQGVGLVWALACLSFALFTLLQLSRRKRKLPDRTLLFWRLAMACLIFSSFIWIFDLVYPVLSREHFFLLTGILYLLGFAGSLINAMMYKIIPFLSWFHPAGKGIMETPNMKEQLPDRKIIVQFTLYFLFLVTILSSIFAPALTRLAGIFLIVSAFLLFLNLRKCVGIYKIYFAKTPLY